MPLNVDQLLLNLQAIIPNLIGVVMAVSFVGGLYCIMRGFMMLKVFGQPLTQMSRPGELGGPLGYIIVGAILIYIPTTIDAVHYSFFGIGDTYINQGNRAAEVVMGYGDGSIEDKWASLKAVLFKYVNFIGLLAFVRGWFIISKAGQPGVQPGTISKGLTHVIAGIIAINLQGFIDILKDTVGI